MIIEEKLTSLGLALPDLDALYRTNRSGARFLSHFAVQNVLYLSGTTPVKDNQPRLLRSLTSLSLSVLLNLRVEFLR